MVAPEFGEVRNPLGRPKGSRNIRTVEIFQRLEHRGDLDPADFLSSVVTNTEETKELRIQAAGLLMPYKYSKCGAQPVLLYIEQEIRLPYPDPTILAHARANIWYISQLKASKQIALEWGDNLIADQYKIIGTIVEETKLAIAGQVPGDQVIRIEGGLPNLPGTAVIMPGEEHKLNGHSPTPQISPPVEAEP
jgi:hypothetical protein